MLVAIPPKISVSSFMGYLKGKSSLMIFDKFANLRYKYGNRKFWCEGYYVDTVGRNKKVIEEYIRHQLDDDIMQDKMSVKEYIDPFSHETKNKKKKRQPLEWQHKKKCVWLAIHWVLRLSKEKEGYTLRTNHPFYGWL